MNAQALSALSKANEIRSARARLKQRIAKGEVGREGICEVLKDPPDQFRGMKVYDLIKALPSFGPTKAKTILRRAGVRQNATVSQCPNLDWVERCLLAWPEKP